MQHIFEAAQRLSTAAAIPCIYKLPLASCVASMFLEKKGDRVVQVEKGCDISRLLFIEQ